MIVERGSKKDVVALNVRNLQPEIRQKFKELCVRQGVTMQDKISNMILNLLEEEGFHIKSEWYDDGVMGSVIEG